MVQNLITTDPFLSAHCTPVLYECEPASQHRPAEECLVKLEGCQVYLLMVYQQYGSRVGGLSMTHAEYRRAREMDIPTLVFVRGDRNHPREDDTRRFLQEVEADGRKYKRWTNVVDLQEEVRLALVNLVAELRGATPTAEQDVVAAQTIRATSPFESQRPELVDWDQLDHAVLRALLAAGDEESPGKLTGTRLLEGAIRRGLVWRSRLAGRRYATAAGIILLARDPSAPYPQCRILADAYLSTQRDRDPSDQEDIRAPAPLAINRALAFVARNTRHPMRVVGLNRVRLDEYPEAALREALVNAVSHRDYEDAGRKIILEVFADHVSVLSPGLPPPPLTIARLRSGRYRACSRNPVVAHCLSYFHRIEERGSGLRRMKDATLDHGLDPPTLGEDTGYFEVRFSGPGDNVDRLRVPDSSLRVTPAVEAMLNERQRRILAYALEAGRVNTGWCMNALGVARDTAHRDLTALVNLGLLERTGKGRTVAYIPPD